MAKLYRISITADQWPTVYNVEANNEYMAAQKALKMWRKKFKGSRASKWSVTIFKSEGSHTSTEEQ